VSDPQLYVPHFNAMAVDDVRPFVADVATAQLVTVGADGFPDATFLPVLWEGDRLFGHLARANGHWRRMVAEHGRVVPTWNYSVVHLRGRLRIHDDSNWVRDLVTRLTDRHERPRDEPWHVTDAPEHYVAKNLRPIVGVELVVESVEAKAKLSQNRSDEDRAGVAAGLAAEGRDPDGLVAP